MIRETRESDLEEVFNLIHAAFGGNEKVTIRMKEHFMTRIPNPTEITLEGVGHFVKEEMGPELASLIYDFIADRPLRGIEQSLNQ